MTVPADRLVFVWENLGPTHLDRLGALAAGLPAGAVRGVQLSGRSNTYGWDATVSAPFDVVTLGDRPVTARNFRLVPPLLRACLRGGRADIFLCHYQDPAILLTAMLLRLLGRRVWTMGDSKFDDYPRRLRTELVKALFFLPYRGALTASLRARDYLRLFGFRPERIALGYDTLSVDRIAALAGAPPAPDGAPFAERDFAVVARHVPKKNLSMAIEAFALWLAQTDHPRDLHLCGSGPLEAELRAQAERLGVAGRIHFHGFIQTDAVSRILARALCLLLTSTEEQFGLVVIEAQALGLPVLVTANAGACDVLVDSGVNGFVLDPANPAACAALMLLLSEDEARWRRFATAARDGRYRGDCRHFVAGVLALTGGADAIRSRPPA